MDVNDLASGLIVQSGAAIMKRNLIGVLCILGSQYILGSLDSEESCFSLNLSLKSLHVYF